MSQPVDSPAEAVRIGQVALDDLAAPGAELVLLLGLPCEHAHGQLGRAQRVDDLGADEAGSPGDEDHSLAKFFQ